MKLAFCLFEYFPFGGMQRDCVRIAQACVDSGADVTIFTREWTGPCPPDITVQVLPTKGWTNAKKAKRFVEAFERASVHSRFDGVVGFSKMPGLDVYFAADPCFVEKSKQKYPFFYQWTPNYRTYSAFEEAVFSPESGTEVLLISPKEKKRFAAHYHTPDKRMHLLPPGILPDRCAPIDYAEKRRLLREGFSLKVDEKLMLFVGSGFKTKGLDRAIKALAALPAALREKTQLWVVGEDDPKPYHSMIRHLKLDKKVFFLGGRHDIPELLWVADVLCHPAYSENTGTVLLEAMVAGLPVLTTDVCGYANYVKEAQGGIVLASPFQPKNCVDGLAALLNHPEPWRSQGIQFGLTADLYSMVETAQNLIENVVRKKMIKLSPEVSLALGAAPFETLMQMHGDIFRQQGSRETLRVVIDTKPYFLKRYRGDLFGRGAKPEWEGLRLCERLGVKVPKLMGFGARELQSFVLMEAVENADSLENVSLAWVDKARLIKRIAQIARTLHQQGYYHRDFYLCHFLWNRADDSITLIDLHRLFKPRFFKQHYLEKDLSGLLFSALDLQLTQHDVYRFLKIYFDAPLKEIFKKHGRMLKACERKAVALYHKAYHHEPRHVDWITHRSEWPPHVGMFHHIYYLEGKPFESDACLRVLRDRRMVMSGTYDGNRVVVKFFTRKREFERECVGMRLLGMIPKTRRFHQGYVVISPYISGDAPKTLSSGLLACLADLHRRDLIQTDPHLNNFRVNDDVVHVLDPASMRKSHLQGKKWDNLALVYAQWPRTDEETHLAMLPEYCAARGIPYSAEIKAMFLARLSRIRAYSLRKWLSKTCRNASSFYAKSRWNYRVFAKREFANVYAQSLLRFPDSYFREGAIFLKKGRSNTVVRATIGDHDVVIKRFNLKTWLHFFKGWFRGSKAKRAWRNAHLCRSLGIATPEPLAMIEKRFCFIPLTSYLVTAYAPGMRLDQIKEDALTPAVCAKMAAAIARVFALFETVQCVHGDLKASNWIWDGHTMQLIDLDSLRMIVRASTFDALHEKDRVRFLRNFEVNHPLRAML